MYFLYDTDATDHLAKRDKKLGMAIAEIGSVQRTVNPNLFSALVDSIISQQISSKAAVTVLARLNGLVGNITPESLHALPVEEIQKCGMSMRKAEYIKHAAAQVLTGALDMENLQHKSDLEVCRILSSLNGVGVWTAEMLMLFSMQRPDILSYGDFAIHRGIRMLYRHRTVTREQFERLRKRYSPYGSVASLYLWAIAGGVLPQLTDPGAKKPSSKPSHKKLPVKPTE